MIVTWVPEPTFIESAKVLRDDEVHRVRTQIKTILDTLAGREKHYVNLPAVAMWRGAELALVSYGVTMCQEWKARGYRDVLEDHFMGFGDEALSQGIWTPKDNGEMPYWLGDSGLMASHRATLVRSKDEYYYRKLWPDVFIELPLVFPPSGKRPVKG